LTPILQLVVYWRRRVLFRILLELLLSHSMRVRQEGNVRTRVSVRPGMINHLAVVNENVSTHHIELPIRDNKHTVSAVSGS